MIFRLDCQPRSIPMMNEAVFALEEGVASAEAIDLAMVEGNDHPVGPLALADRIGLDTVLAICEVLHEDLGDPSSVLSSLRQYVEVAGSEERAAEESINMTSGRS